MTGKGLTSIGVDRIRDPVHKAVRSILLQTRATQDLDDQRIQKVIKAFEPVWEANVEGGLERTFSDKSKAVQVAALYDHAKKIKRADLIEVMKASAFLDD